MIDKRQIVGIASGNVKFDLLFTNAKLVNVYTEDIMFEASVGIINGKVAAINPKTHTACTIIDCKGKYMLPGFIDSHMHIETSKLNPVSWAKLTLVHGTTTAFCDPMVLANVYGEKGISLFNEMTKNIPTRIYTQIPSRIPSIKDLETNGGEINAEMVKSLLSRKEVASLGEVSASALIKGDKELFDKIRYAKMAGMRINGHYPMPEWDGLNAFAAAGICDDHESTTYEELKDKLSVGLTVMVREGSIEPNTEELITGIVKNNLPTDNLLFCTDDKFPPDLINKGHIDYAVKKAVSFGLDPIKAVKMATLNAAKYYRMDHKIGSVTPGRNADMILVNNLKDFDVEDVFIEGRLIVKGGKLISKFEMNNINKEYKHPLLIRKDISLRDYLIRTDKKNPVIRVLKIEKNKLTVEQELARLSTENGVIVPDIVRDILPILVIERYGKTGGIGKAFVNGLEIKDGAIACSMAQEANNIVVSGTNYSDIAEAVLELKKLNGGMVVVKNGRLLSANPMPIGGIMYECDADTAISRLNEIKKALKEIGCEDEHSFSYLIVATAPSIPKLGLTDYGIIDVEKQEILDLFSE